MPSVYALMYILLFGTNQFYPYPSGLLPCYNSIIEATPRNTDEYQ